MKNPLRKRLPRELIADWSKYLVIFLFITVTIGFISGFLVTGNSMIIAYDNSFDDYHIENGHFVLQEQASDALLETIEKEKVRVYPDFYVEEETDNDGDGETDSTLRIFYNREEHNQVCLMKGKLPETDGEIAVDRMYADNNDLKVGDEITCGEKRLTVTGLVALSDYSALFSDTTDMMFDAVKFGVAIMTEEGFAALDEKNIFYSYAWYYQEEPEDEIAEKEVSDDLMEVIAVNAGMEGNQLTTYIPRYANSAINFTGEDMGGDRSMMLVLLYILIVILAFVFAVTIKHTIIKEASVIGTLRASGYTKGELLRHYITLPMLVTLAAALVGNLLGYTVFIDMVKSMYYGSYSLPTYKTIWNGEAFVLTTVVPLLIMLLINILFVLKSLKFTPLQFLRHDLSSRRQKRTVKLPDFSFLSRFRLRIIFQNKSSYITLFVGIFFAFVLLLFGLMMPPLLKHYRNEVVNNMIAEYQYTLKTGAETENPEAEKYCAGSLKITMDGYPEEDAVVYGIVPDSTYITADIPEKDGVYISDGFAQKYRLHTGDEITLREIYGKKKYTFTVKGTMVYPATLSVFMSQEMYNETFDKENGFFNGYFSDVELTDIEEEAVLSCITEDDLTKTSRQLDVSMGHMFYLILVFAVVLFVLLIYLLTKLIIEKNTNSISMVKILGYQNREIAGLYLLATTAVVIISMLICMFLATEVIDLIYFQMMKDYSGWLLLYMEPKVYVQMFVIGVVSYLFVAAMQMVKIKKIPMDEALKRVE